MKHFLVLVNLLLSPIPVFASQEFVVMVYNVENLFDLDGVAIFSEYEEQPEGDYGPEQLLNKLKNIHRSLLAINDGAGPEIVMLQELELDRTPFDGPDPKAFLEATRDCSVETLLTEGKGCGVSVSSLPSELLLLKYLEDKGMKGYQIAQPDPFKSETHPPHKNVVFSRFPIRYVRQRPMLDARDLLVVGVDVDGHELVLLNNHWKSGASATSLEPVRVQNARVVRAELDAILYRNPQADVIIAGDLNCYYNQSAVFPEVEETGVNTVLKTHGFEEQMLCDRSPKGLYNLWYERPLDERGSEVWRGKWGTLMQMILTPGLYDAEGIQYVDNSFDRLILPGENVETRWGRPVSWSNFGRGAGFSDHLPVHARFRISGGTPVQLVDPSNEPMSDHQPVVDFRKMNKRAIPPVESLNDLSEVEMAENLGELFILNQELSGERGLEVMIGGKILQVYSPIKEIRDLLFEMRKAGKPVRAIVEFDTYRGNLQLVIRDRTWLKNN